jgi:hypothetical protein
MISVIKYALDGQICGLLLYFAAYGTAEKNSANVGLSMKRYKGFRKFRR